MTLIDYFEESGMDAGQFVRAINHITGGSLSPDKFRQFLKGKRSFSDYAIQGLTAGAKVLVEELLPLHDGMLESNPAYEKMNPLVVAFYNAAKSDPQVMADFEWWAAACKASPKLKLISHDILGLTLQRNQL